MTQAPARTTFGAPWSWELGAMSAVGVLAIGLPIISMLLRGANVPAAFFAALAVSFAMFGIRGYEITAKALIIRRMLWNTQLAWDAPVSAVIKPRAMAGSWRLWGNGGFFAFSGRFSNSALGPYRAFVTDLDRTVVLTTPHGLIVVSPDNPDEFAQAVRHLTAAVS